MAQRTLRASERYKTYTSPILLRLTPEQFERLDKIARRLGKTRTDFLRDATMKSVAEHEDDLRDRAEKARESAERALVPRNAMKPRGLGLRPREERRESAPIAEPQTLPTVVINNGPVGGVAKPDVDYFVAYVKGAGNQIERQMREQAVTRILEAAISDPKERAEVARQLDEKLGQSSKPKETKSLWSLLAGD